MQSNHNIDRNGGGEEGTKVREKHICQGITTAP